MRDEQHGSFLLPQLFKFSDAAIGEDGVTYGECFIHD